MNLPTDDVKRRIPVPLDRNILWQPPSDMTQPLTPFQQSFILSACPAGTCILSARFHRMVRLLCPIWVHIVLPNNEEQKLILRMDYTTHGVEREALVLPLLAKHGLSVPTILAGPVIDPSQPEAGPMMLLNVLPGKDLLSWAWDAPPQDVNHAIQLVLQGVERLHKMTKPLNQEPLAQQLPHRTLLMELQKVVDDGGPWLDEPVFAQAIQRLYPIVQSIQTPLAFSSGDYNQGNFLLEEDSLTGFIDFTGACFEDPHVGMTMYWIYSWYPLDKAGIVERYLEQHHMSFADFAPRLAIRCLRTLQQQIAVLGGEDLMDEDNFESHADYRNRVLRFLERAMLTIS